MPAGVRPTDQVTLRLRTLRSFYERWPASSLLIWIDAKIGWGRIGFLLSLGIIAIAGVILYRMLREINFVDVIDAVEAVEKHDVVKAGLFVAAGYLALTFYDLFALRTIGHPRVPYRIAALAGFTSYAVGHNVGASVFTGGAVRYRIYSHHGLSAIDVAKLCFVAGLTFWLGNAAVLGLGIIYSPRSASAIDQLPLWFNSVLGVAIVVVLGSYLVWVWRAPRKIGNKRWEVTLPRGPSTLLQIAIGIIDLFCCAFAMYMLVPADPHVGFIELSVIFVSATLLGFASHSPGGLGVFDAAMLVALWQYDKEDLFAGLLLFRLLYYITPFVLALFLLGARELWFSFAASRIAQRSNDHAGEVTIKRHRSVIATPSIRCHVFEGDMSTQRSILLSRSEGVLPALPALLGMQPSSRFPIYLEQG